jgi:hypothetical protein
MGIDGLARVHPGNTRGRKKYSEGDVVSVRAWSKRVVRSFIAGDVVSLLG